MNLGGYRNRVARVDLTHGKVTYEPLNQDDLRKYVGGRGLGAKYVFDNGPEVEPLSPKIRYRSTRSVISLSLNPSRVTRAGGVEWLAECPRTD